MNKQDENYEIHETSNARNRIGWQNEPDPTMKYLNPFASARNLANKRQTEVAFEIGVEIVEIIRLEQAIFTKVPRAYVDYYRKELNLPEGWEAGYRSFQRLLRQSAPRPIHGVWQFPQGEFTFRRWRLHNWPTMSQTGWCKAFCIHPAALYAIEKGARHHISPDILNAMVEANIFSEDQAKSFAWKIKQSQSRNLIASRAA
jgi:hypothetical protein